MKKKLFVVAFLFIAFVFLGLLVDQSAIISDRHYIYSVYMEGITFFSILFCLMLTIQFKTERILVFGWFFLLIGAFMDVLDEGKSLSKFHMLGLVFENGMFAIGMLSISIGFLLVIKNREELNEKLKYMALHDSLTGLPNRYMLNDYLEESLARCKRNNQELAIMFLDLDRFKFINDTSGHEFGDMLLKQVTERLLESVREGDIVVRQGGDEFIILLEGIGNYDVRNVAEGIHDSFQKPFLLNNEEVYTSPSIGISLYPKDGNDNETLIKCADKAMYVAKKRGKNNYHFFDDETDV